MLFAIGNCSSSCLNFFHLYRTQSNMCCPRLRSRSLWSNSVSLGSTLFSIKLSHIVLIEMDMRKCSKDARFPPLNSKLLHLNIHHFPYRLHCSRMLMYHFKSGDMKCFPKFNIFCILPCYLFATHLEQLLRNRVIVRRGTF